MHVLLPSNNDPNIFCKSNISEGDTLLSTIETLLLGKTLVQTLVQGHQWFVANTFFYLLLTLLTVYRASKARKFWHEKALVPAPNKIDTVSLEKENYTRFT